MEGNMMLSPEKVYENLSLLEQVDAIASAISRQLAQEIIADPKVSLSLRLAIADRLNDANRLLTKLSVSNTDSY